VKLQTIKREVISIGEIKYVSDQYTSSTIPVGLDALLRGEGSKQHTVFATSASANPVLDVQENFGMWSLTAVIENLIIDGQNLGVTGIRLRNVYNCWVRNVTIKNCDAGIQIDVSDGKWSEYNHLKHIRMINVKKGILFTNAGTGDSAGFTTIDDVGIALKNDSSAVGIQIGTTDSSVPIKPYSSFIKANVWMGGAGGTGMQINKGELTYSLVNLEVEGPSNGVGVRITESAENRCVYYNQFSSFDSQSPYNPIKRGFLLTCGGLSVDNRVKQPEGKDENNHDILAIGWT
jgi:hypothetical protein